MGISSKPQAYWSLRSSAILLWVCEVGDQSGKMGLFEYSYRVHSTGVMNHLKNGKVPVLKMQVIKQGPKMNLY